MEYFAGLDASLEETSVCVMDELGVIVREAKVFSEPETLVGFLTGCDLKFRRIGLEACSLARWLHAGLSDAGLPAICIETRQAKAALSAMPNKTDRNDARGIAQIMRTDWFRAVHVKCRRSQELRALLSARRLLVNKRRDIENEARALLREFGFKVGPIGHVRFATRVRELMDGHAALTGIVKPLLAVLATLGDELARLHKQALDQVRNDPVCHRLMTVPGVGPLTALTFRATIDQPQRFGKSRMVGPHLGLTPRRYQSGETDVSGRISKCGDEFARTALYEAANSLLTRVAKWSALKAWGMSIARRKGLQKARVAVARKMAVILHRMWVDQTDFRWTKVIKEA